MRMYICNNRSVPRLVSIRQQIFSHNSIFSHKLYGIEHIHIKLAFGASPVFSKECMCKYYRNGPVLFTVLTVYFKSTDKRVRGSAFLVLMHNVQPNRVKVKSNRNEIENKSVYLCY